MSLSSTLIDALRSAMDANQLSQTDVAVAMEARGFPFLQSTVWKILSGNRRVNLDEAVALADVAHIDLVSLIQGKPVEPPTMTPERVAAAKLLRSALDLAEGS